MIDVDILGDNYGNLVFFIVVGLISYELKGFVDVLWVGGVVVFIGGFVGCGVILKVLNWICENF